jgi:hypothetical protein
MLQQKIYTELPLELNFTMKYYSTGACPCVTKLRTKSRVNSD